VAWFAHGAAAKSIFLTFALVAKLGLVGIALLVAIALGDEEFVRYGLIALLALAMGFRTQLPGFSPFPT
jgi:hypothetical protein